MSKHVIYSGLIRHRRYKPASHEFSYRLFMLCVDLDHLPGLFSVWPIASHNRPSLGWFKRKDYIGKVTTSLKEHVLAEVEQTLGFKPEGKVTLLTHLRMWGVLMNPIAIFSCYDKDDRLQAVALQVTNTPWGEQCLYVLKADPEKHKQRFKFDKAMHVSPFNPMDMGYICHYMLHQDKLVFHLENHMSDERITDATLVMQAQSLTRKKLIQSILIYPYMTCKVFYGIYKQALVLYLKNNPIYTNPATSSRKQEKYSQGH